MRPAGCGCRPDASPQQRRGKRTAKPPERLTLEIAGAASKFKTPRANAAADAPLAAPTPMTDEFSTGGFAVGDAVEAQGRGPGGAREWFQATVTKIRPPPAWPPIMVRFTATLHGVTNRLALPDPVTAYCHADDVQIGRAHV